MWSVLSPADVVFQGVVFFLQPLAFHPHQQIVLNLARRHFWKSLSVPTAGWRGSLRLRNEAGTALGCRDLTDRPAIPRRHEAGVRVSRKRVQRLMRAMGLRAICRRPSTRRRSPEHPVYPYLLRNVRITRPNQMWAADITYLPMARGFLYLVAVMDWHSRYVVAWQLSNTLEAGFCAEALEEALGKGQPEVFNTDQGSQFTSLEFIQVLHDRGVRISMDGKGRYQDNIFVERLWRTVKYEEVYLKAYASVLEAQRGLADYFRFYNGLRPHQVWATGLRPRSSTGTRAL